MKIITWNCNGGFRKKFKRLLGFNADIYIIQECEEIGKYESFQKELLENSIENFLWTGENKNKGLGVFSKKNIEIEKLDWNFSYRGRTLKYFLPFQVNKEFRILAVWNHHADAKVFSYIGQFWLFLQNNKKEFKN
ncbi:MAG TPA: endonuclease/exonuclease/phosphatase family protein, partial [Leptospiraceae bacterium]|nr:endonuclease/exonuclease/phosphatase family protein [Leptospiraceae bacterium]